MLASSRDLLRPLRRAARSARRDAAAGDHDRGSCVRGREGRSQLHQHPDLPRRLPPVAGGDRRLRGARDRHAPGRDRGHDPALRPHARRLARRFSAASAQVPQLGYADRFVRLWEFYLCYSEGGFAERRIEVAQHLLAKPRFSGHLRIAATGPAVAVEPDRATEPDRAFAAGVSRAELPGLRLRLLGAAAPCVRANRGMVPNRRPPARVAPDEEADPTEDGDRTDPDRECVGAAESAGRAAAGRAENHRRGAGQSSAPAPAMRGSRA